MSGSDDREAEDNPGGEDVGSVAEEAAKLLGALSGWARTHGGDVGHGLGDLASTAADAARDANEHLATGAPECTFCPVCRVVHVVRECSPEVRTHLVVAGMSLMQAAAALLATQIPDEDRAGRAASGDIERIDLDADWPEESGPGQGGSDRE